MLINCLLVACGGGCGAVLRYLLGLIPMGTQFPIMTLVTNVLGGFAIGFFCKWYDFDGLTPNQLLLAKTGFCGGFTTFSTFSLETMTLLEKGMTVMAVGYALASVLLCLLGVFLGRMAAAALFKA